MVDIISSIKEAHGSMLLRMRVILNCGKRSYRINVTGNTARRIPSFMNNEQLKNN